MRRNDGETPARKPRKGKEPAPPPRPNRKRARRGGGPRTLAARPPLTEEAIVAAMAKGSSRRMALLLLRRLPDVGGSYESGRRELRRIFLEMSAVEARDAGDRSASWRDYRCRCGRAPGGGCDDGARGWRACPRFAAAGG